MSPQILLEDWGTIPYKTAWDKQDAIFSSIVDHKLNPIGEHPGNTVALCEHPHVFTLGKNGLRENLLVEPGKLWEAYSAEFYRNNRGGDITYHGPGQVVAYPILDLDQFSPDLHQYMRNLEEVIILTLADYGLKGERSKGATGVWIDIENPAKARKICAMGVKMSRWVTMHGLALNVNTDLKYFDLIIPCGISDKGVTSLQKELGHEVNMREVKDKIVGYFAAVFHADIIYPVISK